MRRLLALIGAIVLVDTMFYAAITPLLPYYTDTLDLSKTSAGVLAAAYPAGTLLGALPAGWLAGRVGVKPTVLLGLAFLAASSVAFGLAENVWLLDAARFVQGLSGAASWAGGLAWLVRAAPRDRRGEMLGIAFGAAIGGALLGPVVGALANELTPAAVFSGVAAVALGLFAWAWREPAPARAELEDGGVRAALRSPLVLAGLAAVVLVGVFFGVVEVLVPLRLDELGAGAAAIGATFVAAAAIQASTSPLMGRLADRRGAAAPIRFALIAACAVALLLPLPSSALLVAALLVASAPTVGALWVPGLSLLSAGAEAARVEQAVGFALMNVAWAGSQTVGAAGGAAAADAASDGLVYVALAVLMAAALAAFLVRPPQSLPATAS